MDISKIDLLQWAADLYYISRDLIVFIYKDNNVIYKT